METREFWEAAQAMQDELFAEVDRVARERLPGDKVTASELSTEVYRVLAEIDQEDLRP